MNPRPLRNPAAVLRTLSTISRSLFTVTCLLFTVHCLLFTVSPTHAQSQSTSYWQYAAAGRLQQIIPADLNEDGISEFIVVDESGRVAFVNAQGEREWSLESDAPVRAVGIVPLADAVTLDRALF
ncbi:MAG: hypothetical protein M5U34_14535 [Chloroflexi bacterium]|nr:hypothetical protein [Chloroflexota bacterium]